LAGVAHVLLAPEDSQLVRETIDAIAQLTGQRPSLAVLRRAGVSVTNDAVKLDKAEKTKRPDDHRKAMTALMWALARAARLEKGRRG
jgi:hypothetical protein